MQDDEDQELPKNPDGENDEEEPVIYGLGGTLVEEY